MCTLIILRQPENSWPLLIASNRDEMLERSFKSPFRHWPDRSQTIGGLDEEGSGTWLGINDYGVVAAVLNRKNSLGFSNLKRSRGELPLEALEHEDALTASEALQNIDPASYKPFNLIIADSQHAFWLCVANGAESVQKKSIPLGVSMIADGDLNDTQNGLRIRKYLPMFKRTPIPNPDNSDWSTWENIMADTSLNNPIFIKNKTNFGTVSTSLISMPSLSHYNLKPIWKFHSHLFKQGEYIDIII